MAGIHRDVSPVGDRRYRPFDYGLYIVNSGLPDKKVFQDLEVSPLTAGFIYQLKQGDRMGNRCFDRHHHYIPSLTPAKLLAVLGLGSVAVGFAFKDIFENFFAAFLSCCANRCVLTIL